MHHASIGPGAVLVRQNSGHIRIRIAGMDDQRQSGLAGGLDMNAKAFLLDILALGRVMVIQPGFANPDHFRMRGNRNQFINRN